MMIRILTVFFVLFSIPMFAQHISEKSAVKWMVIDEEDYSIQYPDTFDVNRLDVMQTSFILLSHQTSDSDLFKENINLIIQDMSVMNIDAENYIALSEKQIKAVLSDNDFFESKKISKNGREYQQIIFTGQNNKFLLKFNQLYWFKNGKAYVLTLTCEENQYDKYLPVAEKIMGTFKLK